MIDNNDTNTMNNTKLNNINLDELGLLPSDLDMIEEYESNYNEKFQPN